MKKMLLATAVAMAFGSTAAFAHHPAEDIVSDEIWDMVNTQLEESDSPHLTMDTSDMDNVVVTDIVGTTEEVDAVLSTINTLETDNTITVVSEDLGDGLTEIVIIENVVDSTAPGASSSAPRGR
jgi:hypothetical protein